MSKSSTKSISGCLKDIRLKWSKNNHLGSLIKDWEKIAGKQLASNSNPISLRKGLLVVGASHPQWRQALIYNRLQLLSALNASGHPIKEIRIQQHHPSKINTIKNEKIYWNKHPSRIDIHGISKCKACNCPAPEGEIKLWGKCSFCRRKDL